MTLPEIKALRQELEVALLQAFSDFERMTGASITSIDVAHVSFTPICSRPERHLSGVTVELELS